MNEEVVVPQYSLDVQNNAPPDVQYKVKHLISFTEQMIDQMHDEFIKFVIHFSDKDYSKKLIQFLDDKLISYPKITINADSKENMQSFVFDELKVSLSDEKDNSDLHYAHPFATLSIEIPKPISHFFSKTNVLSDWNQIYSNFINFIWELIRSAPFNFVRINPLGQHKINSYYYVFYVE